MKIIPLLSLLLLVLVVTAWFSTKSSPGKLMEENPRPGPAAITGAEKARVLLSQKAAEARIFARNKGFNEQTCFFMDLHLPSGQNRFFVYDLRGDSVLQSGPVAHGNCFEYWLEGRRYSNVVGSGCSSLGKYRIGHPYTGKFGYSYKLHGLDSSNNNAFERTVVLHSHSCVPETETPDEICQSNGCPTVSPSMLAQLKPIINSSRKPVLLWIYDEAKQ